MLRAFALTITLLLAGCASMPQLQPPGLSLKRVELLQLGFDEQRFGLDVEVINPNGIPLPINGMRYALSVNGIELGRGENREPLRIDSNGSSRVQLELSVNAVRLLGQLSEWTRRPPTELSYQLDAELDVAAWPRPLEINREGRVPLRIDPSAFSL